MDSLSESDKRKRRRRRLAGNGQWGMVAGLAILASLVAGVFALGGNPDLLSTDGPFFSGGEPGPGLETGESVYAAGCLACHGVKGTGNTAAGIPALDSNGEIWKKSESEVKGIILDGGHIMPGQRGLLSGEQIELLVDFLQTLWTQEQQEAFQSGGR